VVNAVRALHPAMVQCGVATAVDVGLDTLEDRLLADLEADDATMIVPPMTAAWVRVPPT